MLVGLVESLWRYPVKSMGGESLDEAFVGFSGIYGDRLFAFHSSASPEAFPYFTAREQKRMLLCRPKFRHPAKARADPEDLVVDVETPAGAMLAIDNPSLIEMLADGLGDEHALTLVRSDRAMTDCHPVSLLSIQTADTVGDEVGVAVDKRRFRANIYVDLDSGTGFGEDEFVGRTLRLGSKVELSVLARDSRCKMITLDPDTGESNPKVLRPVAQGHEGKAGVYAAVIVEGTVRPGDAIELL